MRSFARPAFVLSLAALAACSSNPNDERTAFDEIRGSVTQLVSPDNTTPPRVTLTDAQLNAAPVNITLLTAPKLNTQVGLVPQAVNRDIVTWVTPEGYSVSLKGGQIVGTAGFAHDLASASVPSLGGGTSRVVRDHYSQNSLRQSVRTRYVCTLSRSGGQRIVVTGRAFDTTLISEDCRTEAGDTTRNQYWIDGRGIMRKSNQFVSDEVGYFQLEDVHTGLR